MKVHARWPDGSYICGLGNRWASNDISSYPIAFFPGKWADYACKQCAKGIVKV